MSDEIVASEILLEASRFSVERVTQRLEDGKLHNREIVRHRGAVVILPLFDDGSICLIKNFRVAVGQTLYELPAGTLEPNEPPIKTAERELIEETGYRCQSLENLCQFYSSPGITDEQMHAFVARGLAAGDPEREVGEQIENEIVSRARLDELLRQAAIQDGKTLVALLYFLRYST